VGTWRDCEWADDNCSLVLNGVVALVKGNDTTAWRGWVELKNETGNGSGGASILGSVTNEFTAIVLNAGGPTKVRVEFDREASRVA
jgi:hypothetical protein